MKKNILLEPTCGCWGGGGVEPSKNVGGGGTELSQGEKGKLQGVCV